MTSLNPEDLEQLANENEKNVSRMQELTETLASLEGVGYAADERIKATVKDGAALSDLTLDPRVMRMDSAGLAEAILEAAQAASADLQRQVEEKMKAVTGESPFAFLQDASNAQAKFQEIQDGFQKSIDDILGQVDKIRQNLPR